jgi:tetratricopeptide (TPR) repeat protein
MLDAVQQRRLLAASGYVELGLYQEAVRELEAIPEGIQQTLPVLAGWADLYQSWQKWEEARAVAERLTEIDPEEPRWVVALAYATRRSVGLVAAQRVLVQGLESFPDFALIRYNLACYAAQLGDLPAADRLLRRACELDAAFSKLAKTDPDLAPLRVAQGWGA